MAAPGFRVEGARELRRTVRAARGDLSDLKAAHQDVAGIVVRRAARDAPRVSGALAASGRPGAGATAAVVRFGSARVPYAPVIHWGWPARNIRPQPFAVDAAEASQAVWLGTYERHVQLILNRIRGA